MKIIIILDKILEADPAFQTVVNLCQVIITNVMRNKILIVLLFFCTAETSYAQSFDQLNKTSLQNKALINFVEEFISLHDKEKGIYKMQIFRNDTDQDIYEISFISWWYPYPDDIASLAYVEINDHIVLLFSGLEQFFPSEKRHQAQTALIKNHVEKVFSSEDVPPTGIYPTASIVICSDRKIVYQADHGLELPNEYSCIIEEPAVKE